MASFFAARVRAKQPFSLAAIQRDMAIIDASCSNPVRNSLIKNQRDIK